VRSKHIPYLVPQHKKGDRITRLSAATSIGLESSIQQASREKDSTSRSTFTCFLSLPFTFQDLRQRIIQTIESLGEFQVACRFVTRSKGTQLRQEVIDELVKCDFIIADVSSAPEGSKGPRPNIMWELGYAWHMGLNRIIMVRRDQIQSNVASLIIDQHYIPYDSDSTEDLLRELRGAVVSVCNKAELARTKQRSEGRYSANVYIDRVEANLQGCIRDTRKNIRILETNLENIVHEYGVHLVKALKDPIRPDLTVQICTLNPHSPFARARALQLAQLEQDYEKGLMSSLREMYNLLCKCDRKRWEIRVYDTFPTQLTFTFDDRVFSSVMSLGKRSREMLHFEVSTFNRNAGDTFRAHFNQIWGLSDTYEDWLKKETSQGFPHKQGKSNTELKPTDNSK
jgi:hypothetical protein